jgi:hypothetical protein
MEGLGFEVTIPQHGYGWFLEKVDWETMTFKAPYSQYMAFNNVSMQRAYRARYSQIRDVQDDFIRVSKIQGLLQQFKDSPRCRDYLQDVLQQLCLCAFRKDVFQHIKGMIKKDMLEPALAGRVSLCVPSVRGALQPRYRSLNLVSGKRLAVQSIEVLFVWLWGQKEGLFKRKHWEDKPYRLLFQRSFEIIGLVHGRQAARGWRAKLRSSFIKSHWLLPYPQGDRFMKSTGKCNVYWWSSYHAGVHAYLEDQGIGAEVPARHISHYPLDGWGPPRVPGEYMPYTIEPEQDLVGLTESEVYEEVSCLSLEPPPPSPDLGPREVYCILPSGHAQQPCASEIEADLTISKERLKALRYPRKSRHPDPGSESEQSEGGGSSEALSDTEELTACTRQQEKAIQEKEEELKRVRAWEEKARRARVSARNALINRQLREKREAREREEEEVKRRHAREIALDRAADERRRERWRREKAEEEERRSTARDGRAGATARARKGVLRVLRAGEYPVSLSLRAMQDAEVSAYVATFVVEGGRGGGERRGGGSVVRRGERVRKVLRELDIISGEYD